MARPITVFEFHKSTSSPSNGNEFSNFNADTATINFSGDATSFDAVFEGKVERNATYTPISGANLDTLDINSHVKDSNTSWSVDIAGFSWFRVRLVSISGGDISISGRITSGN